MSFNQTIYRVILLVGGVLCSANLAAQQIDSAFFDVNYIRTKNVWGLSKNATGLKYFKLAKVSNAEMFFEKSNGQFKNFHQSDDSYEYGLNAYSLYRLNQKTVFQGGISYHSFKGKNMGGSAFIDPYKNPFDIVELDDNNKGTKARETYSLNGALSTQLTSKFTVGGRINYQAANFAKAKDLRHTNKLLDMEISVGGTYNLSNTVEIGINYNYDRRIESILFKTYGNYDKPISSLVSFGAFYGKLETFAESGYTYDSATRPLTNFSHGFSLQLGLNFNQKIKLFNELTYGKPKGFFGLKGSSSIVLAEHMGEKYAYNGVLSISEDKNEHQIALTANYNTLTNYDNTDKRETNPGGISTVVFIRKEVLDRQQLEANLSYKFFKEIKYNNPAWVFDVNVNYSRRQQTVKLYPYYRDQIINSYQAKANLQRNVVKAKQMYSFALGLGYGSGSGISKYDDFYVAPSGSTVPKDMDQYLYQEFEYFTKPRVLADLTLQYTKKLKRPVALYAKAGYNYTKAFDTQFLGGSFSIARASIGCNF